ncbi:hypothetical protein [Phycobacter sp. K97]|uniref:hypothetical protein n=1 Tax=Phycobacter sedimenti TaxID=3133977 RepID=UPI0031203230
MPNDAATTALNGQRNLHDDLVGQVWQSAVWNGFCTAVAYGASVFAFREALPRVDYGNLIALGGLAVAIVVVMTFVGIRLRRNRLASALEGRLYETIAHIDQRDPQAAAKAASLDQKEVIRAALAQSAEKP